MNQFAIFGSGFGLYGYLPALVSCGQSVVLPDRYRSKFHTRPELALFSNDIQWLVDDKALFEYANGAVFALQPNLQHDYLMRCLTYSNIERLLLEKPLAQSPQEATILFDRLIHSGKAFRIGYLFRYTNWGRQLLTALSRTKNNAKFCIEWHFLAHHFRCDLQNWKRFHNTGGGIIRFYGIHLIALLAEIGYRQVVLSKVTGSSMDECDGWQAFFSSEGLPDCEVIIDSRSPVSRFKVIENVYSRGIENIVADLQDPFDLDNSTDLLGSLDRRVPILHKLCHSLWQEDAGEYDWYAATIQLWCAVEEKTQFIRRDKLSNVCD